MSTRLHINAQEADVGTVREVQHLCKYTVWPPVGQPFSLWVWKQVCRVDFKTRVMHTWHLLSFGWQTATCFKYHRKNACIYTLVILCKLQPCMHSMMCALKTMSIIQTAATPRARKELHTLQARSSVWQGKDGVQVFRLVAQIFPKGLENCWAVQQRLAHTLALSCTATGLLTLVNSDSS